MAVNEIGDISQIEGWESGEVQKPMLTRMLHGILQFARKKPLGFICGLIVIFFFIVGDAVPAIANKISKTAGLGDEPVPYMADQLEQTFGFIYPYAKQDLRARLQGASSAHLLGTDAIGRDILSRLLYGSRTAVVVAFGAVLIQQSIGGTIGIAAGYYGGWIDKSLYRVVDVFQALPGLVVLITILGIFGSGLWQLVFVIGALFGPTNSRVIRGQTLYVMASPFIEAAKVVGAGDMRIMTRYVLPNVFHLIVLGATLSLGFVVLLEATLSFLGYGLPPPFPSWGQMLSLEGRQYMRTQPGLAIYPGVAIGILVFSFNLFGDALRDALDPRLRGSR
jgi:ABC-type dipeptide/oligopeptide/nickel transport system permease subunit